MIGSKKFNVIHRPKCLTWCQHASIIQKADDQDFEKRSVENLKKLLKRAQYDEMAITQILEEYHSFKSSVRGLRWWKRLYPTLWIYFIQAARMQRLRVWWPLLLEGKTWNSKAANRHEIPPPLYQRERTVPRAWKFFAFLLKMYCEDSRGRSCRINGQRHGSS